MYCPNCGAKETGRFCGQCGHPLPEIEKEAPAQAARAINKPKKRKGRRKKPWYKKWQVWTAAGVVAVGGTIGSTIDVVELPQETPPSATVSQTPAPSSLPEGFSVEETPMYGGDWITFTPKPTDDLDRLRSAMQEAKEPETKNTPAPAQGEAEDGEKAMVWVPTNGGSKYHAKDTCSGMEEPKKIPLDDAKAQGFDPCKRCY